MIQVYVARPAQAGSGGPGFRGAVEQIWRLIYPQLGAFRILKGASQSLSPASCCYPSCKASRMKKAKWPLELHALLRKLSGWQEQKARSAKGAHYCQSTAPSVSEDRADG